MRRIGVLIGRGGPSRTQARRRGIPAGAAAIGLDRRPQPADRLSLGRGQSRQHSQIRGGIGRARAGRHPGRWHLDVAPLLQATRTVPIVFVHRPRSGRRRLRRQPGAAGRQRHRLHAVRIQLERKWLELLKQIAPGVTRAAVLRDPAQTAGVGQFAVIQSVAPSVGVEVSPVNVRDAGEIERAVAAFARSPNGGLIVTASALAVRHRDLIVTLAARHKLPAVYYERNFVAAGGLISYGPDFVDQYRRAAGYVDRILKGEKPADLPVQAPTKYELVINLKTAKALGLEMPPTMLARADEVIE